MYCRECGARTSKQWIPEEGREREVCGSCGRIYYQNPRVIVASVVHYSDKVLMCRRSQEPGRGQWYLPSGFLECGETLTEGAARETLEETGVVIDPEELELGSVINLPTVAQVSVVFRIGLNDQPLIKCGPECLEVAFLPEERILMSGELAWRAALGSAPRDLYDEIRSGDFSITLITIGDNHGRGFKSRQYRVKTPTKSKR